MLSNGRAGGALGWWRQHQDPQDDGWRSRAPCERRLLARGRDRVGARAADWVVQLFFKLYGRVAGPGSLG